ncbi:MULTISPECIES: glycosyltransferase [Tessaracoccus]|uniref:glycosyltransferase n=1 Tax=Tessaracoccus TaxID=72763 RepID=UPI00099E0CFC|nr:MULTISPECIES: glycosyltransferase [Tessaracoccus]AQX15153.1 hypothetical protein BKM78_03835 [Tessaracoccus sp. T2.5-30]VEP39368.1 hypothetical protein TLA_TLA_00782 [Tessaracoccus lapidicaptus]
MTDEPLHGRLEDLWSWIENEDPAGETPAVDPADVVAVMVVHNAAEWLPRQLLALAGLQPRPGRLIAVDTGSTDSSPELLAAAAAEGVVDEVRTVDADVVFGAAVAAGLADAEPEWVWLLHDDSAPRRDTLAHLLEGARQADLVVPKLLQPKRRNYPDTLSEAGQAITAGGIRVPLVEEGDVDQRQTEPTEVLGGSTAGMLVRGSAWRETGGLAPEVPRHRDGVEFGWRVNALGYRVLTWPDAALVHRRAGRTGERPAAGHPHLDDRLAALRVAGSRGASRPGLAAASLVRAAGFLLAKSPGHARAELSALRTHLATPEATRSLAARFPEEDHTPAELLPNRFWPVRHAVDRLGSGLADRFRDLRDSDTTIDDLTGDDFAGGRAERRVLSPVTLVLVVLIVAAAAAARTLLGLGAVSGGGLLPAPASLAAAWQAYLTGEAPWLGAAAVASLAGLGSPGWAAFLALLAAPVLAALAALALLRRLGLEPAAASGGAAAWAAATLVLGLVTAGDITGMVLAVAGPLLARSLHAVHHNTAGGAERLRAPAGAGFWLLVVTVVWPLALPFATAGAVWWVLRDRSRLAEALTAVGPPWLVVAPWLPTLLRYPGRWLTGVDPLAWPDYPPASSALILGRILPSGLPLWLNVVVVSALAVTAAVGLARLRDRGWRLAVGAIGAPLILGALLSRVVVTVDGGTARPLLSPWALLVVAALLAPPLLAEARRPARRPLVPGLLLALGILAAGVWAVVGFAGPVREQASVLPGYVRDVVTSERDTRALLIELDDGEQVSWNAVDSRRPRWGAAERNPVGDFAPDLQALVQAFATGTVPDDVAAQLTSLGVSHVWLRGFGPELRAALDNAAGLSSAAADADTVVWTVTGLVSRVTLVDGDTSGPVLRGEVPDGAADRTLVVAEPPGADWAATVDGRELERADADGRLTFALGADGGDLDVGPREHTGRAVWHGAVLALIAILAAPSLGGAAVARRGQE